MRTFTVKPKQNVTAAKKLIIDPTEIKTRIYEVLSIYLNKYTDDWEDYTVVEVVPEEDRTRVEVRSEYLTSFDFAIRVSEALDRVVAKYDPDAYFDCEDSGILVAFIY